MPNWCMNSLVISGDKDDIKNFIVAAQGKESDNPTPLSFESLLPCPILEEEDESGQLGHDWRVSNWGTKWDTSHYEASFDYRDGDNSANYSFNTAWSSPIELFNNIVDAFPNLNFLLESAEPGMGFGIRAEFSAEDGCYVEYYDWKEACLELPHLTEGYEDEDEDEEEEEEEEEGEE